MTHFNDLIGHGLASHYGARLLDLAQGMEDINEKVSFSDQLGQAPTPTYQFGVIECDAKGRRVCDIIS